MKVTILTVAARESYYGRYEGYLLASCVEEDTERRHQVGNDLGIFAKRGFFKGHTVEGQGSPSPGGERIDDCGLSRLADSRVVISCVSV